MMQTRERYLCDLSSDFICPASRRYPGAATRMRDIVFLCCSTWAPSLRYTHAELVRSSEDPGQSGDPDILRDLVYLKEHRVGANEEPLARVRKAARGILYADDAGIVSKPAEEFAKMTTTTFIVTVFEAASPHGTCLTIRRRPCCYISCEHRTKTPHHS